ncbi:MAG: electron transport complex subunit RsxC [Candidatus Margulisbacteria bacterium]|nr:electron transport complex subunit RsxC [Candidatus Margulisiibacteriota bacterium]
MSTFKRGIHPFGYHKAETAEKAVRELPLPKRVVLPLQQNLGCPNEALVKVGDEVHEGQKIADSAKFVAAPIHAPISGRVTKIEKLPNPCGFDVPAIVIDAGENAPQEARYDGKWSVDELAPEQIRKIVREAGIVGLGGAAFPTHVKLSPPPEKKIGAIIINGCECEPYITADHRIMLERTEDVLYGAKAIAKAVGADRIIIGVEDNKQDAIEKLKYEIRNGSTSSPYQPSREKSRDTKSETNTKLEIQSLKTKYPQGGEKMLIKATLGREVPSGGLALDVGVVVQNVGTAVAVAEAIKLGKPLIDRVVTVTGSGVKEPQNLLVRIGTSFLEIIEHGGGLKDDAAKLIMGGPMMGLAVSSLDLPVVKATTCLLVLSKKEVREYEEQSCIRCGRCIKACPIGLTPNFLADFIKLKDWARVEEYHVADCIECGCCAYVCPSRIYLVQYFKIAKRELQTRKAVCR